MFKRFNLFVKRIFNSTNSLDFKNLSKNEIIDCFLLAINTKDVSLLQQVLLIAYKNGLDIDYSDIIVKLLSEDWHDEHEDLVNAIYLQDIKSDDFIEPLKNIIENKNRFRKYDDETESTLRTCIHALKTIDSIKANNLINELKQTNNPNILSALENYN